MAIGRQLYDGKAVNTGTMGRMQQLELTVARAASLLNISPGD